VIDFLLMTAGTCLAAYSGSLALSQPNIGFFAVIAIALGATSSYAIRKLLLAKPLIRIDGVLYAAAIVSAFLFARDLSRLMPDGGYPSDVMAAGWITWMLILGSFFTWQDSTLLFQAIPAIAFFGLSGIYDTFKAVTFAFFGFVLCLATLFARAHRRSMLVQAAESGYFTRGLAPGTPIPSVETTPGLAQRMEDGPWKWIAGPQWALGSALLIVILSLLGAPVVQSSVSGVSGFVHLPTPASIAEKNPVPKTPSVSTGGDSGKTATVGQGPNKLSNERLFEISMDRVRYLQEISLDDFRNKTWAKSARASAPDYEAYQKPAIDTISSPQVVDFEIRLAKPINLLALPGPASAMNIGPGISMQPDGTITLSAPHADQIISGKSVVSRPGTPTMALRTVPPIYYADIVLPHLGEQTAALLASLKAGAKDDYEVAERIRSTIADRITYNINASQVPSNVDPVEYSLFTHQEAYCDIYATCMTLMARAAGIPARYCVGYLPEASNQDTPGHFVVLGSDYHAWSELYFKDFGWVVFDATEGAKSVPGNGRGSSNIGRSWLDLPWVGQATDVLIGVCGIVGLYFVYILIRGRQSKRVPISPTDSVYVAFSRVLYKTSGRRRFYGETADEYMTAIAPTLGPTIGLANSINKRLVRLMYGGDPASPEDLLSLRADVKRFKVEARMIKKVQNR
jgi:transglutaminase-like putative cysteine protease